MNNKVSVLQMIVPENSTVYYYYEEPVMVYEEVIE